jgi:DNA-binding PadR family transcriptional regulator
MILGLLNERPSYGYELEKIVEQRRLRQWASIGFSSIYAAIQSLRRRGWLKTCPAPRGKGPRRRLFCLSASGRRALRREVYKRFAFPGVNGSGPDLAIMFFSALVPVERRRALKLYERRLQEQFQDLWRIHDRRHLDRFWESRQIVRRHARRLRAEIAWVKRASKDLPARSR